MTQSSPGWAVACYAGQGPWVNVTLLQVDPQSIFITTGGSTLRPLARCQLFKENLFWDTVLWHAWRDRPNEVDLWAGNASIPVVYHRFAAPLYWWLYPATWYQQFYADSEDGTGPVSGLSVDTRSGSRSHSRVVSIQRLYTATLVFLDMWRSPRNLRLCVPHRHTDKQTDTSNEHIISAIHFVHLAEIMMTVHESIET